MDLKILICVENICLQGMRLGKHDGLSHLNVCLQPSDFLWE